jgi:2-polyprenyl-3-methyl-5-hydroxy-6-metoxy-1,4-benzoquinol methylase
MGEEDEILVCGCGSSPLSVDMYDEGFSQVTNVDLSRVVIDIMSEKFGPDEFPGMKCE